VVRKTTPRTRDKRTLALHGGPKAKARPYTTGKKHSLAEHRAIRKIFVRGEIAMTRGPEVMELRRRFAKLYGAEYCVTASSGTAAIHTAMGALGIGRGDEVITTPFTDMGTLIAILAQNAVPVFADVDPANYLTPPEAIEAKITPRTRAILVVHLVGNPCDMPAIMKIARQRKLPVVEDVAQSYLCKLGGRLCGTFADIGCFSLNETKHIGAGDGGMLITNDAKLAERADLFADKCYDRTGKGIQPFFAPYNYRLNNLVAAVCIEQLKRVRRVTATRHRHGNRLSAALAKLPGMIPLKVLPGGYCTYYYYSFHVDEARAGTSAQSYVEALQSEGVPVGHAGRRGSVLHWPIFRDKTLNPHACAWACPLYKGRVNYHLARYPGVQAAEQGSCVMPISEHWTSRDMAETIAAFRKVSRHFARK